MSDMPCKRFWEGQIGITVAPRKQHNGNYFWTFSLCRSYKRNDKWEYTQHFGQKHAEALGRVMSKAMQFMEQNEATAFVSEWMTANAADSTPPLHEAEFPPPVRLVS